jgi:hypothetical protein
MFTENQRFFGQTIASTMVCPNFKNGPKIGLRPLGVKATASIFWMMNEFKHV